MIIRTNLLDIALCLALAALALIPFAAEASNAPTGFTENKGQIHDQFRKPNAAVLYLLNGAGMNVQLRRDGFGYDTYAVEGCESERVKEPGPEGPLAVGETQPSPCAYRFHRIDLRFVDGNPNAEMIAEGRSEDYTNYYTDVTGEAGATFVRSYTTITYKEVWPHIDVRCNATEDGFKYDVIVRPGGSLADVRFKVEGATVSEDLKGELVFTWPTGSLNETIPESWVEQGRRKAQVNAHYSVGKDATLGFSVEHMPIAGTLVIDPAIQWATYYGGTGTEGFATVAMDDAGNTYLAGETSSATNIATVGSHDATINGYDDGFLAKLTPACARLWGTYFGGSASEQWVNVQVNGSGTAALSGYTLSTSGIASAGAHQTQLTGTADAFLMLFDPNGIRQWGTYYGGESTDRGKEVSISLSGRVALVGETYSSTGIASVGAPDVSYGGNTDGFVAWFSPTGTRLFGSYIGGSGNDSAWGVAAGFANSEFVVSGHTTSSTGIATSGSHDATFNGGTDAFLALYNGSGTGTKTWCTYYGGAGVEYGRAVTYTGPGVFVMCGHTTSTTGIGTANGDQPTYGGGTNDGFHASFDRWTKARIRGSYAGGANEDAVYRIAKLGNQGYALGAAGFSAGHATPGSFGPIGPGRYVAGYTSSGIKNWSGYLPDSDLYTISIGANSTALVAVGGNELGDATTTPGVHQPTSGGGWDLILHRLVNTTPPMLMPLQDEPAREAPEYKFSVTDKTLSVMPIGNGTTNTMVMLRVLDATGRLLEERIWNGSTPLEFAGFASGTYVFVAQAHNGAQQATRFVIP